MIAEKQNADGYRRQVFAKFVSFSKKSPLLLDVKAVTVSGIDGLQVSVRDINQTLFYPWSPSVDPKSFIHQIKQSLEPWYPVIEQSMTSERPTTSDDIMEFLERGFKMSEIPTVIKEPRLNKAWRIDKVVVWRDIAILVDVETGEQFRYKLGASLVLFLKKYRSGAFKDRLDDGEQFFSRASLLNKIDLT